MDPAQTPPPPPVVNIENTPPPPPAPPVNVVPPPTSAPTPPPPPPPGIITEKPKGKMGVGKLVAALVVMVVLMGGLAAGIYLSQRQQNVIPSQAAGGWCNADGAGTDYGSPCSTRGTIECGGDGKETICGDVNNPNSFTWHATGNCCGLAPTQPPGSPAPMCPNDPNTPIANYVKFLCPNGCTQTTENGVTAWRCYENRQDSNSPLTLNGGCGQVDALSGSTDQTFCGYTEYTCGEARCQPAPQSTPTTTPPTSSPTPNSPTSTPTRTPTPTTPIATPTPTTPVGVAQCQTVSVLSITRGGTAVASPTLAKIQKGDVVVFRGFATATNATVTSIDFTLTKAGVAQTAVHVTPILVSGTYHADYQITVDQATSYSVSSSPTYN